MTGDDFIAWLEAMKAKYGYNKQECGQLLGHGSAWVTHAQKTGCSREAALACAALFAGFEPFTAAHAVLWHQKSKHRVRA